jgi:CPA2 family monovalent cation:H+ antiporter-2
VSSFLIHQLVVDLLIVLVAGFLAGVLCKRSGVSLLVGYLVVGAVIGEGGLGLVSQAHHELEYLARGGALLLLFSVGIEFSLEELLRMTRFFLLGGATQMLLVALPLLLVGYALELPWNATLLAAAAAALSSTVLVFKALAEWGQTATPHGRRAIGILLFQDVALLPLMLLVPLLTGQGAPPAAMAFIWLGGKSLVFVGTVLVLRQAISAWMVPTLARLRSVELVILFTLSLLGGVCYAAYLWGFPPAIGALAAGLMLSGNRLSKQVDTIVLPFREVFATVFFVTLGSLLQPLTFFEEPWLLTAGLLGILLLKWLAGAVALKLTGLNWRSAAGMGLGLAQLGEFSFLLIAAGVQQGVLRGVDYNRILFIAMGTLILTPQLLKLGLRWTGGLPDQTAAPRPAAPAGMPMENAMVVGLGPTGRQIASRLETLGVDVCLVDLCPINLHAFSQQGFPTVAGDARQAQVLRRTNITHCHLAVVCVSQDEVANETVRTLRSLNASMIILVRCRFLSNVPRALKAGANSVISEEQEASGELLRQCDQVLRQE